MHTQNGYFISHSQTNFSHNVQHTLLQPHLFVTTPLNHTPSHACTHIRGEVLCGCVWRESGEEEVIRTIQLSTLHGVMEGRTAILIQLRPNTPTTALQQECTAVGHTHTRSKVQAYKTSTTQSLLVFLLLYSIYILLYSIVFPSIL